MQARNGDRVNIDKLFGAGRGFQRASHRGPVVPFESSSLFAGNTPSISNQGGRSVRDPYDLITSGVNHASFDSPHTWCTLSRSAKTRAASS